MKHLYLIQSSRNLPAAYEFMRSTGRNFLLLSFKENTPDTSIFFPNSTWTTGRNKLREYVLEKGLDTKYDYFTFIDEDVSFSHSNTEQGFQKFEDLLALYKPFIANPELGDYYKHYGKVGNKVQSTIWFDGIMNAFSREAFKCSRIFPYCAKFDPKCWWMSQYIMIVLCSLYYRHRVIVLDNLIIENVLHSDYPRESSPEIWEGTLAYVFQNLLPKSAVYQENKLPRKSSDIPAYLRDLFAQFEAVTFVELGQQSSDFQKLLNLPNLSLTTIPTSQEKPVTASARILQALKRLLPWAPLPSASSTPALSEEASSRLHSLRCKPIHILKIDSGEESLPLLQKCSEILNDVTFLILRETNKSKSSQQYLESKGFELLASPSEGGDSLYCNKTIVIDFNTTWGVFPDAKDFVEILPASNG